MHMDSVYDVRRSNLASLIEQKFGGNKSRFSREMGFDQPSLTYRLLSRSGPSTKTIGSKLARRIEQVCGVDENWLDNPQDVQQQSEHVVYVAVFANTKGEGRKMDRLRGEIIVGPVPVAAEWVRQNLPTVTDVKSLRVASAYGDSMEPTYKDGDVLFIDTAVRLVEFDAIYAFERATGVYIKRIQRTLDGGIVIISDNQKYRPLELPAKDHINVLGRVVYAWTGARL